MKSETVLLFTNSFPYGKGEQFLETEIIYLAKKFKQVYIFPTSVDENNRTLPKNCEVVVLNVKFNADKKLRYYVIRNCFAILKYYGYLVFTSNNRGYYLKKFRSVIVDLAIILEESKLYYSACKNYLNQTGLLYFYWFKKPVIHFVMLKAKKKIKHKLVSRAHGYDYDPSRNALGFYLFRELELRYIDNLVIASKWGAELEKRIYLKFSSKISSCHLGVENVDKLNPTNNSQIVHLVSCSFITESKRVELIIEILKSINLKIKWTHFGDGNLLEVMKKKTALLPANISCEFLGFKSNSFILNYYKTIPCDLFITTTLLEGGVPVSIMEAIAHGIPVIGTSVAGVPEIVNAKTGFLIAADFNPMEVAEIIAAYSLKSTEEKIALRKSSRLFYENNFRAEKNYNLFIDRYLK